MVDAGRLIGTLILRKIIRLRAVLIRIHGYMSGVCLGNLARMFCANKLSGIKSRSGLHAGTNVWCMRANQRHCLALHVCAHERTLCIVVLKERNQVCSNGKKLSRRYVHAINVFNGHLCGSTKRTVEVARTRNDTIGIDYLAGMVNLNKTAGFRINGRICRRNNVVFFLICRHPYDLIGSLATCDLTIRSLDKAVLIDMRIQCQRADKTNVGAFGSLDGAHTRVV